MLSPMEQQLFELLSASIADLGCELWGIEYLPQGEHSLLRITIDHESGVTLDHCEQVSHQVSGILDVEDPISGHYNLEVSSPGVNRRLFLLRQYRHFCGDQLKLKLRQPMQGRKKFQGTLVSVGDHHICLACDGEELTIAFDWIERANVSI